MRESSAFAYPHIHALLGIITRNFEGPEFCRDERPSVVTHPMGPPDRRFCAALLARGWAQCRAQNRQFWGVLCPARRSTALAPAGDLCACRSGQGGSPLRIASLTSAPQSARLG